MEFDPLTLSIANRYRLLISCIAPRPIAIVGTCSRDGSSVNLAPFSFFNGCGSDPMTLLFCPGNRRDGSEKDTLRNAKPSSEGGQGEFTVSTCTEPILQRAVSAAEALPYGESEFTLSGLSPRRSLKVAPPGVAQSMVTFECRTMQVIRLATGRVGGGNIVIGEVVHMTIDDTLIDASGEFDASKLALIGRMGESSYCTTRACIDFPMGAQALNAKDPFAR